MKRLLLGAALTAICSSAFAVDFSHSAFVAVEAGKAHSGDGTFHDTARLFQLGAMINRYIGVDAGYTDLGEWRGDQPPLQDLRETAKGYTVGAEVLAPAYRQLNLFARAGLFHWRTHTHATIAAVGPVSTSDTGNDGYFGVGLLFGWDNLKFRAGYTRYWVGGDHADLASAGLQYFFPVR